MTKLFWLHFCINFQNRSSKLLERVGDIGLYDFIIKDTEGP